MFYLTVAVLCLLGLGLITLTLLGKFPLNGYPVLMMIPVFTIFIVNNIQLHANKIALNYLDEWMFTFSTFVVLVTFGAVIVGWMYCDILPSTREIKTLTRVSYPLNRIFIIGTICHGLSFIAELMIAKKAGGLIGLYSAGHSFYGGADSDYLYLLFYLTFIGAIPYLQYLICSKNLPPWQRVLIIIVLGLQLLRALLVGQRGWIMNLLFIYLTVPFFCMQKPPSLRQVMPFVLPSVLLVILIPAIRGNIYLGSKNIDQIPQQIIMGLQDASRGNVGSGITDDVDSSRVSSEFILGAAVMSAAWAKNAYTYGTSFYEVIVNPIPRQVWPQKPKNIGLESQVNVIENYFPWYFNPGSAPTGIADVFLNLGFGCIPFWFAFGRIHRWVYNQALIPGNFYGQSLYVGMLLGSVFLLTQSIFLWGTNLISSLVLMTIFYTYARVHSQP
jgi:hypothetical protein